MSEDSPHSPNPRFNGKEKLLKAKEIQLREHELELVKYEQQMTEIYEQLSQWRDQCLEAAKNGEITSIPEMPATLLKLDKMRKKSNTTQPSDSNSTENQEDEELMLLIEESTKTTKEKAAMVNGKLKELSDGRKSKNSDQLPITPKAPANLIEQLTKPPEKVDNESQGKSNPHLINKKIQTLKTHKKCNSVTDRELEIEDEEGNNILLTEPELEEEKTETAETKIEMVNTCSFFYIILFKILILFYYFLERIFEFKFRCISWKFI